MIWLILNTQSAIKRPPILTQPSAAGSSTARRYASMSSVGAWRGGALWSTTDSSFKWFSVLDSLALGVCVIHQYSSCEIHTELHISALQSVEVDFYASLITTTTTGKVKDVDTSDI